MNALPRAAASGAGAAATIALVRGGRAVAAAPLTGATLRRIARACQARALASGLTGRCAVELRLPPAPAAPSVAAALEFTLTGDRVTCVYELPAAALAPLAARRAPPDALRGDEQTAPAAPALSFILLRGEPDGRGVVWEDTLEPFAALPAAPRAADALAPWDDIPACADPAALAAAAAGCLGADRERGGALLGQVVRIGGIRGPRLAVNVLAFAPAAGAAEAPLRLTFTAAAWQSIQQARRAAERRLGASLAVVGWVHGHPPLGHPPLADAGSPFFLSAEDIAAAEHAFAEPWCLTLIADARTGQLAAWGWDRWGIGLVAKPILAADLTGFHRHAVTHLSGLTNTRAPVQT